MINGIFQYEINFPDGKRIVLRGFTKSIVITYLKSFDFKNIVFKDWSNVDKGVDVCHLYCDVRRGSDNVNNTIHCVLRRAFIGFR